MKHAIELIKTFDDRPWLVLGKGPSFNKEIKNTIDCNVMAINETANFGADICLMNDVGNIDKLTTAFNMCKFFVLPSTVYRSEFTKHMSTEFLIDNASHLLNIAYRTYYFDANFSKYKLFPHEEVIHAFNSSFETAMWLLGRAGVKDVYTNGIDHSVGYARNFGTSDISYAAVKHYSAVPIEHYGMKVSRIE